MVSLRGDAPSWGTSILLGQGFWGLAGLFTPLLVRVDRSLSLERGRRLRSIALHVPALVAFGVVHTILRDQWIRGITGRTLPLDESWKMVPKLLAGQLGGPLMIYAGVLAAVHGWGYYLRFRERSRVAAALELDRAQLRASLSEARLEALQAQLQPHFLFNALHAISTLILDDDKKTANEMVSHLSRFLRMTLDNVESPTVPLSVELQFLDATPEEASMDPIRTLIVDDEPLARRNLLIRLRGIADFEIVGECGTGSEAVAAVSELHPDLLFLDIRMPDMDGFGVIERIDPEILPVVVFVTAYDRFALEAFRVHALDYLLKPFEDDRFAETLEACRQRVSDMRRLVGETAERGPSTEPAGASLSRQDPAKTNPYLDRLVIKGGGRVFFLRIASVDWVEAYGNYVSVHSGEKTWLLRRTMREMEEGLDPRLFCRISRSAIVNLDRIKDLEPAARGEHVVHLLTDRELKLTRGYRQKLEALLGDRL